MLGLSFVGKELKDDDLLKVEAGVGNPRGGEWGLAPPVGLRPAEQLAPTHDVNWEGQEGEQEVSAGQSVCNARHPQHNRIRNIETYSASVEALLDFIDELAALVPLL